MNQEAKENPSLKWILTNDAEDADSNCMLDEDEMEE